MWYYALCFGKGNGRMARTAADQLQAQIEAIRRESFVAGYQAAMRTIGEFAAKTTPAGEVAAAIRKRRSRYAGTSPARSAGATRIRTSAAPRPRKQGEQRSQRGTNARYVEEVLQSNAPRALRPAEIRSAIERDKGVAIAFASLRHALDQG
jgi:hypothetical protein